MNKTNNFFDRVVSLETTVKLCNDLLGALDNLHHKVPQELEPRLSDFSPRVYRYRVQSYRYSLVGGVVGTVCAIILLFLGQKFNFDAMLPALLCVLIGASLGIIVMTFRRRKEKLVEKRAMRKYKTALDEYYAKHRTDSFTASMKSANIVVSCREKLMQTRDQSAGLLEKMYALGNIPEHGRTFKTMCAVLAYTEENTSTENPEEAFYSVTEEYYKLSKYKSMLNDLQNMVSQTCDNIRSDESYDLLKSKILKLTSSCASINSEIKAEFSL